MIKIFQNRLTDILTKQFQLSFIRNAKSRFQINFVKMIPQNPDAETVNGSDLCIVHQRQLPLQMLVIRILFQCVLNSGTDTLPHFCCCRIGKGHNQQAVNIQRICFIRYHRNNTLYQHRCFSGTGSRRDKQTPVSQIDDFFLFFCPLNAHPADLLPDKFSPTHLHPLISYFFHIFSLKFLCIHKILICFYFTK